MSAAEVNFTLSLRVDGDDVVGTATDDDGAVRSFSGWLGLLGTIDALACPDADEVAADAAG